MATMNAPALRGWAARRLGERLRGGENVDAGQIDALFVDCSAKLAVRHAAALLWHGGGEAIAALLAHNSSMRAGLGVLARLVLAHALLMIANVGDVASANELLQSLLLLPSSVERRVFSRMEEQLVEGLRALCLPAWADETSTREALVLLVVPDASHDASGDGSAHLGLSGAHLLASPAGLDAADGVLTAVHSGPSPTALAASVLEALDGTSEHCLLPQELCSRVLARAGHHLSSPAAAGDHAPGSSAGAGRDMPCSPAGRSLSLNQLVSCLCASGPAQLCTLCAASELVAHSFALGASVGACRPRRSTSAVASAAAANNADADADADANADAGVRAFASACWRLMDGPKTALPWSPQLSSPPTQQQQQPSQQLLNPWASSALSALQSMDAGSIQSSASSLLATALVLRADALFEPAECSDGCVPPAPHAPASYSSSYSTRPRLVSLLSTLLKALALCQAHDDSRSDAKVSRGVGQGSIGSSGGASVARPFRMPRCRQPPSLAGGRLPGLMRRQWESRAHAVLDTAVRAAASHGASTQAALLEALHTVAGASESAAASLAEYVRALLRRHLRPATSLNKLAAASGDGSGGGGGSGSGGGSASGGSVAVDEHATLVCRLCASLPRARRVELLAAALPTLMEGGRSSSAYLTQALPVLDSRLGRWHALMEVGEESAVLSAVATHQGACGSGLISTSSDTEAATKALGAALDAAAWLHLRAGSDFGYVEWLSALLLDGGASRAAESAGARDGVVVSTVMVDCLIERIKSGWEPPVTIQLQCLGAGRAATKSARRGGSELIARDGMQLARSCGSLLREAVSVGVALPAELRSLQASACPSAPAEALPASSCALVGPSAPFATLDMGDGGESGVAMLLALQCRGDGELRRGLQSLLSSDSGEAQWLDFVQRRMPHQMHQLVCDAASSSHYWSSSTLPPLEEAINGASSASRQAMSSPGPGGEVIAGGGLASHAGVRRMRRQLALLLSWLLRRQGLPGRDRMRELLAPLPDILRTKRAASSQRPSSLELESAVRTYLHGSDGGGGKAVATGDGGGGGSGLGLLPNVALLGSALLRRASMDETAAGREAAAMVLQQYFDWWPLAALTHECRRLVHSATPNSHSGGGGMGGGGGGGGAQWALRTAQVLLGRPRHVECDSSLLPPSLVDWAAIFDASLAERIHLLPAPLGVGTRGAAADSITALSLPVPHELVEFALHSLPALFACEALRIRVAWLLARPAVGAETEARRRQWLELVERNGDVELTGWVSGMDGNADATEAALLAPALSDWVRWELDSYDAALPDRSLSSFCRRMLAGTLSGRGLHCASANRNRAAALADEVLAAVLQHGVGGCAAASRSGGSEDADATTWEQVLQSSAEARGRLLQACSELGESAAVQQRAARAGQTPCNEDDREVEVSSSGHPGADGSGEQAEGGEAACCWVLRAMLRISTAMEKEEEAEAQGQDAATDAPLGAEHGAESEPGQTKAARPPSAADDDRWRILASVALACVEHLSWECLAPGGGDEAEEAEVTRLQTQLLTSPLLLCHPPLLTEVVLALVRRHVAESQRAGCSSRVAVVSRVPRLLRAAVEAAPRLGEALKKVCFDGQCLHARACTLPHLLAVAEELLRPACAASATAAANGSARLISPSKTLGVSRKRGHESGEHEEVSQPQAKLRLEGVLDVHAAEEFIRSV